MRNYESRERVWGKHVNSSGIPQHYHVCVYCCLMSNYNSFDCPVNVCRCCKAADSERVLSGMSLTQTALSETDKRTHKSWETITYDRTWVWLCLCLLLNFCPCITVNMCWKNLTNKMWFSVRYRDDNVLVMLHFLFQLQLDQVLAVYRACIVWSSR